MANLRICPWKVPKRITHIFDKTCFNYGSARIRLDTAKRNASNFITMTKHYTTFAEFWPFYLREHSQPRTRALHYVGTTLVVALALYAFATQHWLWLLAMPLAGYFFAWIAHFTVEKNRPATFTYPLWSLAADFKMWAFWLTGKLGKELERAGVSTLSS